jgi:phosphoglycolate phosphatase
MTRLVLFDIDGTLVWPNGAGALAMQRALEEVFGTSGGLEDVAMVGMTDRSIIQQALAGSGLSAADIQARWEAFAQALGRHMESTVIERQLRACPGAIALLEALAAREDVLLGLVTGNLENTAPIKLRAAGIDPVIFRVGGFGSDHGDRNELPAIAARRAAMLTGETFAGQNIVVVGDTPADVACGKAVGGCTVAVATGSLPRDRLVAARPDYLFPDLTDGEAVISAILAC